MIFIYLFCVFCCLFSFFFFQAEDGIRDTSVTGVQTCALPILTVGVDWLKKNPDDIGMLAHELTHAVQAYPKADPGWLTEGIADYARQLYGPQQIGRASCRERV